MNQRLSAGLGEWLVVVGTQIISKPDQLLGHRRLLTTLARRQNEPFGPSGGLPISRFRRIVQSHGSAPPTVIASNTVQPIVIIRCRRNIDIEFVDTDPAGAFDGNYPELDDSRASDRIAV